ncbi:hypothetical protein ILUMI_17027, partial [Ignelater luminosus]
MERKVDILQKELTETKKENMEVKEKLKKSKQKKENQQERIKALESETRKRTVVVYGITENENETESNLKERINKVGKKTTELRSDRPIVIECTSTQKRMEIIRKAINLKGTKIWISEDYPKPVQE